MINNQITHFNIAETFDTLMSTHNESIDIKHQSFTKPIINFNQLNQTNTSKISKKNIPKKHIFIDDIICTLLFFIISFCKLNIIFKQIIFSILFITVNIKSLDNINVLKSLIIGLILLYILSSSKIINILQYINVNIILSLILRSFIYWLIFTIIYHKFNNK